ADGMPLRDAPNIAPVVPIRKVLRFMSAPWFRFPFRVNRASISIAGPSCHNWVSYLLRLSLIDESTDRDHKSVMCQMMFL
ncbi:hypothetical protein LAV83_30690, partial [Rhizobium sp. VS19-DRK62.2]|uniref:hypothetical protein n=1 Tax=unclassified Rhizobium TaxID=2613769 RepID=UPI001CC529D0